jgi:hypothetical protein
MVVPWLTCALADTVKHKDDRLAQAAVQLSELEKELSNAKAACRPLELAVEQLKQEKARHSDELSWCSEQLRAKVRAELQLVLCLL